MMTEFVSTRTCMYTRVLRWNLEVLSVPFVLLPHVRHAARGAKAASVVRTCRQDDAHMARLGGCVAGAAHSVAYAAHASNRYSIHQLQAFRGYGCNGIFGCCVFDADYCGNESNSCEGGCLSDCSVGGDSVKGALVYLEKMR
eukprot:IDg1716t1